jgi:hypothetical protein
MTDDMEPDDLDRRIERARKRMDTGRADLMAAIYEALDAGRSPGRIGRYAHWTDEYIKRIRDRKAK